MAPPELILADTLEELLFKGVKVGRQRAAYQALFFTVLVSYAGYELVSRDGQDVVATLFWGAGMVIAIWRLLAVLRYAWQLRRNKVERLLELGAAIRMATGTWDIEHAETEETRPGFGWLIALPEGTDLRAAHTALEEAARAVDGVMVWPELVARLEEPELIEAQEAIAAACGLD